MISDLKGKKNSWAVSLPARSQATIFGCDFLLQSPCESMDATWSHYPKYLEVVYSRPEFTRWAYCLMEQ